MPSERQACPTCGTKRWVNIGEEGRCRHCELPPGHVGSEVAMRAAQITYRQLDYWIRNGLVVLGERALNPGSGRKRAFSYPDLVQLRMTSELVRLGFAVEMIHSKVRDQAPVYEQDEFSFETGVVFVAVDLAEIRELITKEVGDAGVLGGSSGDDSSTTSDGPHELDSDRGTERIDSGAAGLPVDG